MTKPLEVRRYCGARKTRGEGTCTRPAGWATDHVGAGRCKFHGGANPPGRKAAQRELAERALVEIGVPVPTDPVLGLGEALAVANGYVLALGGLVEGLHPSTPLGVHPLVTLYGEWTDRLARISKLAADARIETAWFALQAADGRRMGEAMARVLGRPELGLTDAQRAAFKEAVAEELRAIAAPPVTIEVEPAALPAVTEGGTPR